MESKSDAVREGIFITMMAITFGYASHSSTGWVSYLCVAVSCWNIGRMMTKIMDID